MKKISDYMDEAIKRGWIKNDAFIAVKCEVTHATVSRWRSGDRIPEDEEIMVLAETLGEDPWEMLAVARYHKAKNEETRQAWEGIVKKIFGPSIAACLLVMAIGQSQEAQASSRDRISTIWTQEFSELIIKRLLKRLSRILKQFRHLNTENLRYSDHRIGRHPATFGNVTMQRGIRYA